MDESGTFNPSPTTVYGVSSKGFTGSSRVSCSGTGSNNDGEVAHEGSIAPAPAPTPFPVDDAEGTDKVEGPDEDGGARLSPETKRPDDDDEVDCGRSDPSMGKEERLATENVSRYVGGGGEPWSWNVGSVAEELLSGPGVVELMLMVGSKGSKATSERFSPVEGRDKVRGGGVLDWGIRGVDTVTERVGRVAMFERGCPGLAAREPGPDVGRLNPLPEGPNDNCCWKMTLLDRRSFAAAGGGDPIVNPAKGAGGGDEGARVSDAGRFCLEKNRCSPPSTGTGRGLMGEGARNDD